MDCQKLEKIKSEALKAAQFCQKYRQLGNGHMVEFFTANLYEKILSQSAAEQLQVINTLLLIEKRIR